MNWKLKIMDCNRHPARRFGWVALAAFALSGASCHNANESAPNAAVPEIVTTTSGIDMVLIPAGHFRMGSDGNNGKEDETPVREVRMDAFFMDRYEMTQANYGKLVPLNGSHFKGPDRPVEMIGWGDAALYCNLRSQEEGLDPCYDEMTGECDFTAAGYRLPTEAEWEYACRAGTEADYSFGTDKRQLLRHAWYADNADKRTQPVGQKKPNPWGLCDMHGNVAEWCNDAYEKGYGRDAPANNPRGPEQGDLRVLRGGAWNSKADACRSAHRVGESPGFQDACFARDAIGFRCVRLATKAASEETTISTE